MSYVVTVLNLIILGIVAYLFFNFRKAVDTSGVRQVDDYLHELEGSVAQLTEQFERTSTKISKDLLGKATELQALIGECDTKMAEMSCLRSMTLAAAPAPSAPASPLAQPAPAALPETPPAATPQAEPVSGINTVPAAVAARRLSAAELLASRAPARPRQPEAGSSIPASGGSPGTTAQAAAATAAEQRAAAAAAPQAAPPADPGARPAMPSAAGPQEKYRLIFLLASEGMDTASIAKHTNLTRGEVEMLLDLRRQGKI